MVINITHSVNGLNFGSVTQGVSAETVQKRRKVLKKLRILSIVALLICSCNVPVGIVILIFKGDMGFPLTSGAPIWSGLLVLVCSIHGIKVSWMEVDYENVPTSRASLHMKAYHNLNRVSILTSLACIAFSAVYVLYCGRDSYNPDSCPLNEREEMVSNILTMIISVIMVICSIIGVVLFRLNDKVLGLKKLLERVSEENRNARQEQTENTTRNERPGSLELRPQGVTVNDNNITEFENTSLLQRFGPPPYDDTFSNSTEIDYRTTGFENTSRIQRFGLPRYDAQLSDTPEIVSRTTEIENTSNLQRLGPPPHDSNVSYQTAVDSRTTELDNTSHPETSGLPSYRNIFSDPTEISKRTTEYENTSNLQSFGSPVDYNSIDLNEPPPTYEEYIENVVRMMYNNN